MNGNANLSPTNETIKAIQECGKGNSKTYTNFTSYIQEAEKERNRKVKEVENRELDKALK
ncbi:hypothetical protein [Helicobacter rodentium]|nr:hypothetical protein [Helicobacter rodentium]